MQPKREMFCTISRLFASTQDLEFVQGQSQDVPDREVGPNSSTVELSLSLFVNYMIFLS